MKSLFSRITVAYDGSELSKKALDSAIAIAKQDEQIEINIISVAYVPAHLGVDRQTYVDKFTQMLEDLQQKLKELPNKTDTAVLEGNPGEKIVEFAKNSNTDLIIMGSRGLSGVEELFLGSVSHHVTQKADCHVLIIK